jgi:tetratricopeptide (TPR) repeat protein
MSLARANERPQVDLFLGRLYLREGRADAELGRTVDKSMLDKARIHFAAVLEADPRHLVAGNNLAWLLAEHFDRAAEAVRIVEQVRGGTDISKMPPAFIDTMALCYLRANDAEKSKEILRAGLTSYPKDPQLLFRLAMQLAAAQPTQAQVARRQLERL